MACINPDGSVTRPGRAMLNAMLLPATLDQISRDSGVPLYRVRSVIRELLDAGLVDVEGEMYSTTGPGLEKLKSQ
ncbi:MAG: helix-turn-helix domain-containing protein [Firmicutes bacterium]|nr:helix-turn-helix domain-containing protein [Bacillota bacterium]